MDCLKARKSLSFSSVDLSPPATLGSSPNHTINVLAIIFELYHVKKTKMNKKDWVSQLIFLKNNVLKHCCLSART